MHTQHTHKHAQINDRNTFDARSWMTTMCKNSEHGVKFFNATFRVIFNKMFMLLPGLYAFTICDIFWIQPIFILTWEIRTPEYLAGENHFFFAEIEICSEMLYVWRETLKMVSAMNSQISNLERIRPQIIRAWNDPKCDGMTVSQACVKLIFG